MKILGTQEFLTTATPVAGAVLFLLNMIYGRLDRHLEVLQKMASEKAGSTSFQALVEELRLRAFRDVFFPEPVNLRFIFSLLLLASGILTLLLSLVVLPVHGGGSYRAFWLLIGLGVLYSVSGLLAIAPRNGRAPKAENDLIRQWLKDEQEKMRKVHRHEWDKPVQETLDRLQNR